MDKLKMHTPNKADENFKKLAALFPGAVTETINENGEVVRAIDKDVLMQEISCTVVDGNEERYQFTWPDKKKSVLLAMHLLPKRFVLAVKKVWVRTALRVDLIPKISISRGTTLKCSSCYKKLILTKLK